MGGQAGPPDFHMLPPGSLSTINDRPDCHGGCLIDLNTDPYERDFLPGPNRSSIIKPLLSDLHSFNRSMIVPLYSSRGTRDPRADRCVNETNTWGPWRSLNILLDG